MRSWCVGLVHISRSAPDNVTMCSIISHKLQRRQLTTTRNACLCNFSFISGKDKTHRYTATNIVAVLHAHPPPQLSTTGVFFSPQLKTLPVPPTVICHPTTSSSSSSCFFSSSSSLLNLERFLPFSSSTPPSPYSATPGTAQPDMLVSSPVGLRVSVVLLCVLCCCIAGLVAVATYYKN